MLRTLCLASSLILLASPALAEDHAWRELTPKLEGCWDGSGMGNPVSECWIVAEDGRADGLFIMRKNGGPYFAEIIAIDDFGAGVEMRLKHVNGDMTGWEEKDDYVSFRLTGVEADRLIFKGLTLTFDGNDRLSADLTMSFGADDIRNVPFNFMRTATLDRSTPRPEAD